MPRVFLIGHDPAFRGPREGRKPSKPMHDYDQTIGGAPPRALAWGTLPQGTFRWLLWCLLSSAAVDLPRKTLSPTPLSEPLADDCNPQASFLRNEMDPLT